MKTNKTHPPVKTANRPGAWARLSKNHLAVAGLVMVSFILLVSLVAPLLPLDDPNATSLADRLMTP
ncbi:MAG: ABC transporter permease, partial [Desulfotignum balticum]|nr:ABC transporter permease [Desulfotignum balticum]